MTILFYFVGNLIAKPFLSTLTYIHFAANALRVPHNNKNIKVFRKTNVYLLEF